MYSIECTSIIAYILWNANIMEAKMIVKKVKIANFNCTFIANSKVNPMLEYFDKILLPAITDTNLFRYDKKTNNKYYIADVELKSDEEGELLLIGKHYKRVILEIRQDYNNLQGAIPKGNLVPSAPFSVFLIKLSNHRIIHFPDQKGSPNVASLNATIKNLTRQYLKRVLLEHIKVLEKNKFVLEGIKYKNLNEFKEKYFKNNYPEPILDIVPIPSKKLIKEKFESISKITSVTFKIFNLNSEIDYGPHYSSMRKFMEDTRGKSVTATLKSPEEKEEVQKALEDAEGKTYYRVEAKGKEKEEIKFDSETIAEEIPVRVDESLETTDMAIDIYNRVKVRKEINEITKENKTVYAEKVADIIKFAKGKINILRK
jgi:hypothetical protein